MSRGQRFEAAHERIRRLYAVGLRAVEPEHAVTSAVCLDDDTLVVDGTRAELAHGRLVVLAIGKAAVAMARGCATVLGDRIDTGIVLTKDGHADAVPDGFEVFEAAHPVPDRRGIDATRRMLDAVEPLGEGDVVLALISGGGSALLEAPREPVTLADMQSATKLLLNAGAPIQHLNAVRSELSDVKGGGLRRAIGRATCVSLILSDVLGNDPAVIASGPTIRREPDPATALELLRRYNVEEQMPEAVLDALRAARTSSTDSQEHPGAGDIWSIVGDNAAFVGAIEQAATGEGQRVDIAWTNMEGEARNLGRDFVELSRRTPDDIDLLLGGGEATVTVTADGIGGRNTEFALAAALELDRNPVPWVIASLASDGQDGAADAAGAIADAETVARARAAGVDALDALRRNDSARVFEVAGGLVQPGPTGTNVNDVYIALRISDAE